MNITPQEAEAKEFSADRLAEAERAFHDAGLLTLNGIYTQEYIAQIRAAYDVELARYMAGRGGLAGMEGKTFGKNHVGFFPPLTLPLADAPIVAHPLVTQMLHRLLGKDMQCSFVHTNTAYPGSGYQPVHRDSPPLFGVEMGVPHPPTSIVLNIPLCDFTEANGSTEVWPGTHLIVDTLPEQTTQLEERATRLPSTRMNVKAGSLVLRDLRVWHRGMPNQADYPRAMFAIVYQRSWLTAKTISIPQSTWDAWPEAAHAIFRKNKVVSDAEYRPATWEDRE